jgi:hypothetical protein
MDNALYLDNIRPGEPYDRESFGSIVEVSSTKITVKLDSGQFVTMQGDVPSGERVGARKVFREAKA